MRKCVFCKLSKDEKVVFETKNFILLKSKKAILEDHYLLIFKKHIREEKGILGKYWREYRLACSKASNFLKKKTGRMPLMFINPPQMQSVSHFHRHFIDGIFKVNGVKKALQTYLKKMHYE